MRVKWYFYYSNKERAQKKKGGGENGFIWPTNSLVTKMVIIYLYKKCNLICISFFIEICIKLVYNSDKYKSNGDNVNEYEYNIWCRKSWN